MSKVKLLDLFSGIGGFSLAAKWVWRDELEIKGFCDIDEYCISLLEKRFPGVPIFRDIQKLKSEQIGYIDIITGGFPCQDISVAGKGAGINEGTRSGLWFEYYRLIRELRPRFAIIENVAALTSRGLNVVLRDLAEAGYDAEWQCISAKEVGAWHNRERIWIISYPNNSGEPKNKNGIKEQQKGSWQGERNSFNESNRCSESKRGEILSNSSGLRSQCKEKNEELERNKRSSKYSSRDRVQKRENCLLKSNLGRMAYGIPNGVHEYWKEEPRGIPRVDKKKESRKERLMALGNSIVPQIPYLIMSRIKEIIDGERT